MDKELKFADWTLKEIADENNNLNSGYFKTEEYSKYPAYFKLKDAINLIISDEKEKKLNILDIGCGSAWHAVYFEKEKIIQHLNYTGVDISEHMCNNAKNNFPEGKFFVHNIADKSVDGYYDVVFESGVLEILPDVYVSLKNMLKSSKDWFIAHRLYFTDGGAITKQGNTYLNIPEVRQIVCIGDFRKTLNDEGFVVIGEDVWGKGEEKMMTLISRRKK